MKENNTWERFWSEWRNEPIENEADLYFQVGRTTNQKPWEKEFFDLVNRDTIETLELNENDLLVDLCCGNGLSTYELSKVVNEVIGVDFAEHMIKTAKQYKSAPNISYFQSGAQEFLSELKEKNEVHPGKYLMSGSLAYFVPEDLAGMLTNMISMSNGKFAAFFTIVPNEELKWNFYNTDERKQKYLENQATGNFFNDGIGRWWSPEEVKGICSALNLECTIRNQPMPTLSNYRMDILIKGSK